MIAVHCVIWSFALSKEILEVLKPMGKKALHGFWECVKSLQASISFDVNGMPSLNLGLGDIQAPATTLDEIFRYLEQADKPCLIAIDEFQQITGYVEKNVEATLRTYVQHCNNARFIFAGSQRHVMGNMFLTPSRPFLSKCVNDAFGKYSFRRIYSFCKYAFQTCRQRNRGKCCYHSLSTV